MMDSEFHPETLAFIAELKHKRQQRQVWRRGWFWWVLVIMMTPIVSFAAFQPSFLLAANNLSDLVSATTARTNLGLGTVATQAANSVALTGGTIDGTTIGGTTKAAGAFTSITDSGIASGTQCVHASSAGAFSGVGADCAVAPTVSKFSGSLPTTLSSTSNVTTVSSMGTPAAGTYNLPAAANGWRGCLKDGTTNFSTNNATLKGPSGNIYYQGSVAATTGIVLNQQGEELCFLSDGTDYYVE